MTIEQQVSAFLVRLDNAIADTMLTEVAPAAKTAIHDAVYSEVYDLYTPRIYARQKDNGGLSDVRSMEAVYDMGSRVLEVFDLRSENGKLIAPIVESGVGYKYAFSFNGVPRPFHSVAEKTFSGNGEFARIFRNGLRARGFL